LARSRVKRYLGDGRTLWPAEARKCHVIAARFANNGDHNFCTLF